MLFHDPRDKAQAKSEASFRSFLGVWPRDAVEPVEDVRQRIRWDTDACVLHNEFDFASTIMQGDVNRSSLGGVFDRVRDEIGHESLGLDPIHLGDEVLR